MKDYFGISVRVSNELGAGHPKAAFFSVVVVTAVCLILAVVEAVVVLSLRHVVSYMFTGGETVADTVADLCPFLAVTLVLNGIQPVLSGEQFIVHIQFCPCGVFVLNMTLVSLIISVKNIHEACNDIQLPYIFKFF